MAAAREEACECVRVKMEKSPPATHAATGWPADRSVAASPESRQRSNCGMESVDGVDGDGMVLRWSVETGKWGMEGCVSI